MENFISIVRYIQRTCVSPDKNKLQGVTVEKINAVFQGSTISGGNIRNTGIFQDTTIEGSVHF